MYPALTVSETLNKSGQQLLWVGSEGGMEASLVERAGIPFKAITAAGVHGVALLRLPGNIRRLVHGYQAARKILAEFKPDVLLFTGGYVAIPMALAARGRKSLLFVPDVEPGLALKTLARFASKIAVSVDESKKFFANQAKIFVTGYPLRDELKNWDKARALQFFGFDAEIPTILFQGGSSGARSINQAVLGIVGKLIEKYQVIHLTGKLDWETVSAQTSHLDAHYRAFDYLHEAGAALAAADLVVSRAGASCLGEYPYFSLPAVLIPYPYAWRYQKVNADYLADRGAAVILADADLSQDLLPTIENLFSEQGKLTSMSQAMASLRQTDAAEKITALLAGMVEA